MADNLFNISGLEKSDTARAVELVTPLPAPAAAAPPTDIVQPAPAPAAPAAPVTSAEPAPGPPVAAAADPAAQAAAPDTPPAQPSPTDNADPAAAAAASPLPAADPASTVPDKDTEAARDRQQIVLEATEAARKTLLAEMGVQSMDELRNRMAPPADETPEQKQRRQDLRRASVQNYAVHHLKRSPDDFVAYQNAQSATDDALVFDTFKEKWLPTAKLDPAYKDKDLDAEARYVFEQLFHVNSENEVLRDLGARSLKESADQVRAAHEAAYSEAEKAYDEYVTMKQDMGHFKGMLTQELGAVPKEKKWAVEGGGEVVFQLSKLDKQELEKILVTQANFDYMKANGPQKAAEHIRRQINAYIADHFSDEMVATAIKTTRDITASKAAVGAKAPFPLSQQAPADTPRTDVVTKDDDAKVARLAQAR